MVCWIRRPGVVRISGTVDRAHVNVVLLRLLLGSGSVSPPDSPNFAQPAFNIIATLNDSAHPGERTQVTVFGVKFESWSYNVPAEDFVMESISFQAMRIAFEES